MIKREHLCLALLILFSTITLSRDGATLVVTGSVHGQLDPCG